jgi:hypothetical protein
VVFLNDIKKKQKSNVKIKAIDKTKIYTQKLKDNIITIKEKVNDINNQEDNTTNEYGANKIKGTVRTVSNKGINEFNRYGQKSVNETKKNIVFAKDTIKRKIKNTDIKKKVEEVKGIAKNEKKIIKSLGQKNTRKIIKNAPKTVKNVKKTEKNIERTIKGFKKTYQVAKVTTKNVVQFGKVGVKATAKTIKGIIASLKAIISAIIAGGWLALVIIVIICVIGLICSSVFGIFFSNEKNSNNKTMSSVVTEINTEFTNKIAEIQRNNLHDDYEIKSDRAEWKDIISIYAVLVTNGEEQSDVVTLDDKKVQKLKDIFWEMNEISSRVEEVEKDIETTDENGNVKSEKITRKVLYIEIKTKTVEEMIEKYNMNEKQKEQLAEIRKEEYLSMWSNVLYGSSAGSNDIVQVAFSQIGNVGGQPYWSWYGFSSRVEWCACFVSWCANQCGYIDSGIIPKFASCEVEGVTWFKTCGLWQEKGYSPKAGDIIFFDWADKRDGKADHVGIVSKCENGKVYTIEGNTRGDICKQKEYSIDSSDILGYGTPMY